ncbi:MAG TPA: MBL fold metallo-hydrolase, partial [Aggregatilineales bacterium]|nr:MBL fold metallo-hydrolase [Aggregatilineales bacterium]
VLDGVYLISGFPSYMINYYLVGDILVDAGVRRDKNRILNIAKTHPIKAHVLTHVHPDHQGASHAVCEALNIPLWCSDTEVTAMETGDMSQQIPTNVITRVQNKIWTGPAHPVAKGLREGDSVGDFTVLETPGHSPGHLSFWRERDRVLITGDVAANINFFTTREGLYEPFSIFTMNSEQNRQSLHKLASLKPKTLLFGHGKPLLDGAKFVDFVATLG